MKPSESKLLDWLGHILGGAALAIGGWLHTELTRLDRDMAIVKYKVFGVTTSGGPEPSLLQSEHVRGSRARLAYPSLFPIPKTKESPDENRVQ